MIFINLLKYFWQAVSFVFRKIHRMISFPIFFLKYRIKNRHNFTTPKNLFDLSRVEVGKYTYGYLDVHMWGDPGERLIIGDYCSIALDVTFLLGGNHYYKNLLTYSIGIRNNVPGARDKERYSNGKIEVSDDVWLCTGAKIMSGVSLGQGCIVGAYSVVTKDVPPYAIVGGSPAKIIKYRFPEDVIEKLVKIDLKKIPIHKLLHHYNDIIEENFDVEKISKIISSK